MHTADDFPPLGNAFLDACDVEQLPLEWSFFDCDEGACTNFDDVDVLQLDFLKPPQCNINCVFGVDEQLLMTLSAACNAPSESALNHLLGTHLADDPALFLAVGDNSFPVIYDAGTSLAVTGDPNDFVGNVCPLPRPLRLW